MKNNLTDRKSKPKIYNVAFFDLVSEAMVAVMLEAIVSFFQNFSETSLFVSTDDYEKFLVCRDYCVAANDPALCFLKNCKFHLLLFADKDLNDLLVKLDRVCFTYQHVDCFSTLYSSLDSAATFWRKIEKSSIVWNEPFRSTN